MSTRGALIFSYVGYLVRYVYLLILIPFYGRVLGVEGYGAVLAAMSLYTVVWTLTNYGFSTIGARDIASNEAVEARSREFGRHLHARCLLAVLGMLVGAVATFSSQSLRADPWMGLVATALGLTQAMNLGWYFQGVGRFQVSTGLEVMGFLISLALILGWVAGPDDARLVLLALLCSTLLVTAVSYGLAARTLHRAGVRFTQGWSLIRESTPVFLLGGVSTLLTNSSAYLLSLFAAAPEVGAFGSADRLAGIVLALMVPANQVLVSTISRQVSREPGAATDLGLTRTALVVMVLAGGVAGVLVALLAPYLVPLVLGPQFDAAVPLLQVLAATYPFFAFSQVINLYLLIPLRRDKLAMTVTLLCAPLQLAVFVGLSRSQGAQGSAWARLIGEVLMATVLSAVLWRVGLWRRLFPAS